MKTRGQKVAELIDALDYGYVLYRQHGLPEFDNKEFLFKSHDMYEIRGWGTAYGNAADRIFQLTENPDDWQMFPDFNMKRDEYPYPWSTAWKDK